MEDPDFQDFSQLPLGYQTTVEQAAFTAFMDLLNEINESIRTKEPRASKVGCSIIEVIGGDTRMKITLTIEMLHEEDEKT